MPLSKLALACLDSSTFFARDILFSKTGVSNRDKKWQRCEGFGSKYEEINNNSKIFFEYAGMSLNAFDCILNKINNTLRSQHTNFQPCISSHEKLLMTLRFLSKGETFTTLSQIFRVGRSTISACIYQTLDVLLLKLQDEYLPQPSTIQLKQVIRNFWFKYRFPNCFGVIGGKRFLIKRNGRGKRKIMKHKKSKMLLLYAVADTNSKFIYVEVCNKVKKNGEVTTFHNTKLNKLLEARKFNLPSPQILPDSDAILPNIMVGGEAFPLKSFLLRPYPCQKTEKSDSQTIYNDRLIKTIYCIDHAFAMLMSKWTILKMCIETNVAHARLIVKVACLLHNIVRDVDGEDDFHYKTAHFNIRYENSMPKTRSNNRASVRALHVRNIFKDYFSETP